jgi:hypothetical protein
MESPISRERLMDPLEACLLLLLLNIELDLAAKGGPAESMDALLV